MDANIGNFDSKKVKEMIKIKVELDTAIDNQQWKEARDLLDRHRNLFQQLLTENCYFQGKLLNLLHSAIIRDVPMDIVNSLISPQNINVEDDNGNIPLHGAVSKERWELVPLLRQHGADVNLCDYLHDTSLHLAVCHGAPADIITQLISPENINMEDGCGDIALMLAVRKRRWELVPVLLQHGADVNLRNRIDQIPLHNVVCLNVHVAADILTQLISPSNINMPDRYGYTALILAVRKERWEMVPVLLQHGADVNLVNRLRQTPLHLAACHGAPEDIITQLISPHNINVQATNGYTLLHQAVEGKRWEMVPVLLQHGADVNLANPKKQTPLHLAAHHGAPADIITQLISPHNINIQATNGYTLLHQAVKGKRWKLVPVLLQHGADPSMLDSLQLDKALVLSLKALCITTVRNHMPVKSDEAYEGLGLPRKLVAEMKLRPQAEDIVNRGHCM